MAKNENAEGDPEIEKSEAELPEADVPEKYRGILTAKEYAAIRVQAEAKVQAEIKAEAKKEVLDKELSKARAAAGLTAIGTDGPADDLVSITIELPEYCPPFIQVNMPNGPQYIHGQTYTVPRHIADSLREMMFRANRHQMEIDGKKANRQANDGRWLDASTGAISRGVEIGAAA